ncbi:hypothetical protein [Bacillus pakistanensis]|uniref:hypothetical protein n=1 Tax=Rossellomorea pakistanensis TaxID=992288 RepID=UPI001966A8C5|nr:hypothetical protein [Bacillus pakistanensis]
MRKSFKDGSIVLQRILVIENFIVIKGKEMKDLEKEYLILKEDKYHRKEKKKNKDF